MSIAIKFFIIYLIPVLTVLGTYGTYMLGYGKDAGGLVKFSFGVAVLGLFFVCYMAVTLISSFLIADAFYLGIAFASLGCLLELLALGFYTVMFKDELRL